MHPRGSHGLVRPPAPTNMSMSAPINSSGIAVIKWKVKRRGGTYYGLERQLTGLDQLAGPWTHAGSSAVSEAIDPAIPVCQGPVRYRVYARRPTGDLPAAYSNVLVFGTLDDEASANAIAA